MYIVIGWIALQIAFGKTRQPADRAGALHELSRTPFGAAGLWLLVVGFFGMALWRLAEALYGSPGAGGRKARSRLSALARAAVYAVIAYGVLEYAIGAGGQQSGNQQSVDLTAALLRHPGGRAVVVAIGLALAGGGLYIAFQAWRERFLAELDLARTRAPTRRIVKWLGRFGGIARGLVFITVGVFLVVAAVRAQPAQAKGIDSALRALAMTPLGPWLLVLVSIGLVMFGAFSCLEARWRRLY